MGSSISIFERGNISLSDSNIFQCMLHSSYFTIFSPFLNSNQNNILREKNLKNYRAQRKKKHAAKKVSVHFFREGEDLFCYGQNRKA